MSQQGFQTAAQKRDHAAQSTALEKVKTVRHMLEGMKGQIADALPKHLTPERMIRIAMTAIQQTPQLMECDQRSLAGAVVQASQLGLELGGVLGQAYLIPFKNSKTNRLEAQLQIGYRGYIALARRSGEVSSISAEIVYENDGFDCSFGTDRYLKHIPAFNRDRGKKIGAYAAVKFKDGFTDFEYMDSVQIEAIRKSSKAADTGPWKTHPDEMWRKTPIRRLAKRLPLAVEDHDIIKAAVVDEYGDMGISTNPLLGDGSNGNGITIDSDPEPPPPVIEESQRQALAAFVANGLDPSVLQSVVQAFGFNMLADITVDKYTEVYNELERRAGQTASRATVVDDAEIIEKPEVADTPTEPAPMQPATPAAEERAGLIAVAIETYNTIDENAKLEADKFLSPMRIEDLTVPKLRSFIKKFGRPAD